MAIPTTRAPNSPYYFSSTYKPTPAPKPAPKPALPGDPNWAQAGQYGWLGPQGYPGGMPEAPAPPERTGRMVRPDYSGILGSFTADARARFGAGLTAKKAQRLGNARSIINQLGVRDVGGMLGKLGQYGLTEADLQGAAANPWSQLNVLQRQGQDQWQNTLANRAARGGFRSGGTIGARENLDWDLAQRENQFTQEALQGLSTGLAGEADWEREQRDQMEQSIAQQQASLAAAYQPYWEWD